VKTNEVKMTDTEHQSALVVIDVQRALFERATPVHNAEALLQNINTLIDKAHDQGSPVFFFRHANKSFLTQGSAGWELHPALQLTADDILLEKQHGSAFQDTAFHEELQARKINQLMVTGLVTNGCVKVTCNAAQKHGYNVVLVADGHGSYHKEAAKIIDEWNQRLGEQGIEVLLTEAIHF
jgi:nicotinamidase-related amidase